jgi:hypothetical protein
MLVTVRDPKTKEIITGWSDKEKTCCGAMCGGCVACMELQAQHAGYEITYEKEEEEEPQK